jgi:hypothetical protein
MNQVKNDTGYSNLVPPINGKGKLSQLYDTPRKINVEKFYEIMETGNLNLLKVNPEEKVGEERLIDVWLDLQEYYYSNTNKVSFQKFKGNFKKVVLLQNEITACYAGMKLVEFNMDKGHEILRRFGIKYTDIGDIKSAILRKETKLDFAKNKLSSNEKRETVGFYKIVASVESGLNRQLNLHEINLERWVAYLNEIKDKNELAKKQTRKNKKR